MGVTALLYNWGFFTMLGYVPFPMHLSIYGLGAVFFGWGVLVAVFSVFVAPRLQRRFGTAPTLYVNLALFAAVLAVIAAFTDYPEVLVVCVVVAGAMIGVNNTLTTQAVMLVAPVERPVASAAYGFIRFIGGGLAPFAAGLLAERFNVHVPFWIGAGAVVVAIAVLATGHRLLVGGRHPARGGRERPRGRARSGRRRARGGPRGRHRRARRPRARRGMARTYAARDGLTLVGGEAQPRAPRPAGRAP